MSARTPDPIVQFLPFPVMVLAGDGQVSSANAAAETFFGKSESLLRRSRLPDVLPFASPVLALVESARTSGVSLQERRVSIRLPQDPEERIVDVYVGQSGRQDGGLLVVFQEQTIAEKLDRQLTHRIAARSVSSMSAILAHEIKNPLSGISGAAQLLEASVSEDDRALTRLIRSETARIVSLVDRMEMFSDVRPIAFSPVNIHSVLNHVKDVARSGFARNIAFAEVYDPSLPPVMGNRDLLIQVFLNLVKNAAEAIGPEAASGEIVLATAYRPGMRFGGRPGEGVRTSLPLEISVRDNGPGIPGELQRQLFDPFVTTKPNGTGLGLALVAKIIGDHGGTINCESAPRRTSFITHLPVAEAIDPRSSTG